MKQFMGIYDCFLNCFEKKQRKKTTKIGGVCNNLRLLKLPENTWKPNQDLYNFKQKPEQLMQTII
jgi:hypothetical protein